MTQEQIDSIRERMCDNFCWFHGNRISLEELESACEVCPLNELEASAEPEIIVTRQKGDKMDDLISRQAALDVVNDCGICIQKIFDLPSAESDGWLEMNKDLILQAGIEGREVEFRIGGRLFAIREKAQ